MSHDVAVCDIRGTIDVVKLCRPTLVVFRLETSTALNVITGAHSSAPADWSRLSIMAKAVWY